MKLTTRVRTRRASLVPSTFLFGSVLICAALILALAGYARAGAHTSYAVDFTDYRGGQVAAWLKAKGFVFERDAKNNGSIALSASAQGLEVAALKPAQGLLVNKAFDANAYSSVEIEWGVTQHPQGASYERRVNNEAIMVHVFFGKEKQPSGSLFVPDSPYFVGLFLCNGDRVGHAYTGRYYKEGGRYVCVDTPQPGQTVVSRFNLRDGLRSIFGGAVANMVSAYSISVDTSASSGGGQSRAFIKRIRFLS